jgi:hypothetical protein
LFREDRQTDGLTDMARIIIFILQLCEKPLGMTWGKLKQCDLSHLWLHLITFLEIPYTMALANIRLVTISQWTGVVATLSV